MLRHTLGALGLMVVLSVAACSGPSPASIDAASPGNDAAASGTDAASATDAAVVLTDAYSATDPYAAARAACIAEINRLRATHGLPAYSAWTGVEMCVDNQASADETSHMAHMRWASGVDSCNGSGQNECLGAGPDGIVGCLDQMWAEGDQAECAGCDACADAYNPSCPNCDFYGSTTGHVCGHYVNMSAHYFTEAACGFSSLGGWDAINFQ